MNTDQPLSKRASQLQNEFTRLDFEWTVVEVPASTRTAEEAAAAIGCEVEQIIKSLIFRTVKTHRPVLILASGKNRVNEKTIGAIIGEKIEKADANFVREQTGFAIGGIPPCGHKNPIELVYIDETLLSLGELWAAAGTPNSVFKLQAAQLLTATNGKTIKVN